LLKAFQKEPTPTFSSITLVTQDAGIYVFLSLFLFIMLLIDEVLYQTEFFKSNVNILEGIDSIPEMEMFDKRDNHLLIFDDMICESHKAQKPIQEYFIRGR
jgi:hypothetical protein